MSSKDRLIIVVCVLGMLCAIGGAASLMPGINMMRRELQLTANDDLMENMPPDVAALYLGLGSFRGLGVDMMWSRAERLKREGKHYEAMELSRMITKLQPRFPQVWRYQAWNMAYNISVETHTPQERWMWVKAGIELLRDEGLVLNPGSMPLYQELSDIYLHKIGMFSDDMHWYYKLQLAREWEGLLGPPAGTETEDVLEAFRPIAMAYDRFVNRKQLGEALRVGIDELLASQYGDRFPELHDLRTLSLAQFDIRLRNLRNAVAAEEGEDRAAQLDGLRTLTEAQLAQEHIDPMERLLAGEPGVAAVIGRVEGLGLEVNGALLSYIAGIESSRSSVDAELFKLGVPTNDKARDEKLAALLDDETIAVERDLLVAFLRARVLVEYYHMDPRWMLDLMEGEWFVPGESRLAMRESGSIPKIPLDWRHPASHGLYWASMGVRKSAGLLYPGDQDLLNTDRRMLHGLQAMFQSGKILFDAVSNYYRQQPDPRFIKAYDYAMFGASDRIFSERLQQSAAPATFLAGHENFLIWACKYYYFYGDEDDANQYYTQLRTLYNKSTSYDYVDRYIKPLDDFIQEEFIREGGIEMNDLNGARAAIEGWVWQAWEVGIVEGNEESKNRFLRQAQKAHTTFNAKYANRMYQTPDVKLRMGRLALPPFPEILADVYYQFLMSPRGVVEPNIKARSWKTMHPMLKQMVYDRVIEPLTEEFVGYGTVDASEIFPEPPGMEAFRKLTAAQVVAEAEGLGIGATAKFGDEQKTQEQEKEAADAAAKEASRRALQTPTPGGAGSN